MLDGLTLDIAGTARSVDDYESVVDGIGGTLPPGVEIVANAITPAPVSDYGWTGTRDGKTITLSGYVPSLEAGRRSGRWPGVLFAGHIGHRRCQDRVRRAEDRLDRRGQVRDGAAG